MIDAVVRSLTAISLISSLSNQSRVPNPFRYSADGGPRGYVYARNGLGTRACFERLDMRLIAVKDLTTASIIRGVPHRLLDRRRSGRGLRTGALAAFTLVNDGGA